jgi:trimeric autotransporter adhesin
MNKLNCFFWLLFAVLLFGNAASVSGQIITTVAGGDSVGLGDNGPATACELVHPTGVVFDASGNYYITDRAQNRIRKVSTSGIITTIAGTGMGLFSGDNGPATAAEINSPYGIAIDAIGNIYFADDGNERVRKIDTFGTITTIAGCGVQGYNGDNIPATDAQFYFLGGVAVDSAGNVYVDDYYNNRVRKISTSGTITTIAGTGIPGYNGESIIATNAEVYFPEGLCIDKQGNLYVAEINNNRVRKISNSGIITTIAGNGIAGYSGDNGPATACELNAPAGVFVDSKTGNIFIGDTRNSAVRKVSPSGVITTIAGNGVNHFSGDGGPAVLAELYYPIGIASDKDADIYFADQGNDRIRRIQSTVFVNPASAASLDLVVFPNPSTGDFTCRLSSAYSEEVTFIVVDIAGHKIIDTKALPNIMIPLHIDGLGVYMLYAVTNGSTLTQKVIVL